jgi:hypothetical protein
MEITLKYSAEDDDGYYQTEVSLPAKWEVCGRCDGRGVHDPEAFAQGFSSEDFAEDPDFAEDYIAGKYDITCSECDGRTTVKEVNIDRLTPEQNVEYEKYLEHQRCMRDYRAEEAYERRMGC